MFQPIADDLSDESAVGLLLAAQLGNTPTEMALVVRTTLLDRATGSLSPVRQYVIRIGGMVEHKLTLGPFDQVAFVDDHPLLYHHNAPGVRIFISSPAADPDAVLRDIAEAYSRLFNGLRDLRSDLNHRADPRMILQQGMGTLGEVPAPFADA